MSLGILSLDHCIHCVRYSGQLISLCHLLLVSVLHVSVKQPLHYLIDPHKGVQTGTELVRHYQSRLIDSIDRQLTANQMRVSATLLWWGQS